MPAAARLPLWHTSPLGASLAILLFLPLFTTAQRYHTNHLTISIYAKAPVEDIAGENRTGCQGWVDFSDDSVYVQVRVRDFSFPNKLMEKHFHESYMESAKYPFALFRGKLVASFPYTRSGTYAVSARGTLQIHGVARECIISGSYEVQPEGRLRLYGRFFVRPEDYGIAPPRLLWQKIAEVVEVRFEGLYQPE